MFGKGCERKRGVMDYSCFMGKTYVLSHGQDGSSINRNGETVGTENFGRKIRGSELDMMPIRYPNGDVRLD